MHAGCTVITFSKNDFMTYMQILICIINQFSCQYNICLVFFLNSPCYGKYDLLSIKKQLILYWRTKFSVYPIMFTFLTFDNKVPVKRLGMHSANICFIPALVIFSLGKSAMVIENTFIIILKVSNCYNRCLINVGQHL